MTNDHSSKRQWPWALALTPFLFSAAAAAHECRLLGQPTMNVPPAPGEYGLCVGFSAEDPAEGQPGAGKKNNIDFFPLWTTGNQPGDDHPLNTAKGDVVDVKVTVYYLNGRTFEVPVDQDGFPDPSTFFFTTKGVGYETPIPTCRPMYPGCRKYKKELTLTVPVKSDGAISYRAARDFTPPYPGMYAFIISGTLQRKGEQAIEFYTKWVSRAPRVPFGPFWSGSNKNGRGDPSTYVGAPEFWFDSVRPKNFSPTALSADGVLPSRSPNWRAALAAVKAAR